MRTISISRQSKSIDNLLKKAQRNGLILKSSQGRRFVLTPLENWEGYEVSDSKDFAKEVDATVRNKKLMRRLAARRTSDKNIPLKEAKRQLGLR